MKRRTWKVIKWLVRPKYIATWIPLDCICGYEAECPASTKTPIIAVMGMSLIFDQPDYIPPKGFLPDIIKCRKCGRIYSGEKLKCTENTSQAHIQDR